MVRNQLQVSMKWKPVLSFRRGFRAPRDFSRRFRARNRVAQGLCPRFFLTAVSSERRYVYIYIHISALYFNHEFDEKLRDQTKLVAAATCSSTVRLAPLAEERSELSSDNSILADGGCRVNSNEPSEQPRLFERVARSLVAALNCNRERDFERNTSGDPFLLPVFEGPFLRSSFPLLHRLRLPFPPRSPFPSAWYTDCELQ